MLKVSGTRKLGGRDPLRALQRFLGWSLVALFVSLFPSRAHAFTWMIKHGYASCPACHTDPSGGELLTAYGRAQSDELLRMKYGGSSSSSKVKLRSPALARTWLDVKSDASSGADDEGDDVGGAVKSGEGGERARATEAEPAKPVEAEEEAAPAATESPAPAATEAPAEESTSAPGDFLWGLVKLPDFLLLGGSYRHLNVFKPTVDTDKFATFPMMADLYGQVQFGSFRASASIGVARVDVGSPYTRAAQVTRGQGHQTNLLSRTHWVGYDFMDGAVTLRAGRMNLPFGVRIPEHTMWVRQNTRTDRESAQQHGISLSYSGELLRGEVMLIAGNYQINPDKYRERGYSLYAEYLLSPRTAVGVSSLVTTAKQDRNALDTNVLRQVHGPFIRAAFTEDLVLLVEADALIRTNREAGYVGFAQFDYELIRGLHLMATGEVLDEGYDKLNKGARAPGAGQPRFGAWGTIDWFCLPHVEVRADVIKRQNDPTTILAQLHVFL